LDLSHTPHPLIEFADKHLDATFDRLDKATRAFWEGQASFGRSVTTLSSAALVLSVSVAQFLIGTSAVTRWNILLPIAWVSFGIAIVLGAGHHAWAGGAQMGRFQIEMRRGKIRKKVAEIDVDAEDASDRFDAVLVEAFREAENETKEQLQSYRHRSLIMFWSFAAGVALLVTFVIRNLRI
jgi:hypothetical protein